MGVLRERERGGGAMPASGEVQHEGIEAAMDRVGGIEKGRGERRVKCLLECCVMIFLVSWHN